MLNKKVYVEGEPVVAHVLLKNTRATPMRSHWFVYGRNFSVQATILDGPRKGMSVPLSGVQPNPPPRLVRWLQEIKPQAVVTTALDVVVGDISEVAPQFLKAETLSGSSDTPAVDRYALTPGGYQLVIRHEEAEQSGHIFPEGRPDLARYPKPFSAKSSVSFRVRSPNRVEREALNLFQIRPVSYLIRHGQAAQAESRALDEFQTLVRKYSKTRYAPYARYYIGRILQTQGKYLEAARAYEQLFGKHPRFSLRADALYYLALCQSRVGKASNTARASQVLQKLKHEFPAHLIAPNIVYNAPLSRVEALEKELQELKPTS